MYALVNNMLDRETVDAMSDRLDIYVAGMGAVRDSMCPNSQSFYSPFDDYHDIVHEKMEKLTKKRLGKTYNYARIYWPGEELEPHTDREACEYSVTINLRNLEEPWDFCLRYENTTQSYLLREGDGVVYNGIHVMHWREPLKTDCVYQAFFHFVDLDGSYVDHACDQVMRKKNGTK